MTALVAVRSRLLWLTNKEGIYFSTRSLEPRTPVKIPVSGTTTQAPRKSQDQSPSGNQMSKASLGATLSREDAGPR